MYSISTFNRSAFSKKKLALVKLGESLPFCRLHWQDLLLYIFVIMDKVVLFRQPIVWLIILCVHKKVKKIFTCPYNKEQSLQLPLSIC